MAALFCESFDYLTTDDLAERFTSHFAFTLNSTAGRRSSGALVDTNGARNVTKTLSPGDATCIIGVAVKSASFPNNQIIRIVDTGTTQIEVTILADGTIRVLRNGTTLGTSTSALSAGTFYYLELKTLIHDSAGTVDLRINGDSWLSLSGIDTQATGSAQWTAFGLYGDSVTFDDLYVLDGTGSVNNDFLGDVRVDAHFPTGAGATTGWTPSAGSNWQNVDDATPDDDSTYNETSSVNAIDTFDCTDLVATGASIKFVEVGIRAKKTDAGTAEIAPTIRHGGVDYPGTAVALSTDYTYVSQVYEENPDTSAAWTETSFEAAEFGYKKTT